MHLATAQQSPSAAGVAASPSPAAKAPMPARLLDAAATGWFAVAIAGQLVFVLYILAFYGMSALRGDVAAWAKVLPRGHVSGDTIGNLALTVHILIAAIVTIGGPLQLLPRVRASFPAFHRWNGRIYLLTAVVGSLTGMYVLWSRPHGGGLVQHLGITLNGVLIVAAAAVAVRHAMAGRMADHRRWALRLFLLVSGSWFFRVGLMFWIAANGGPAGFDPKTFEGPALTILGFLQYLLPLALLELYFLAKGRFGGGGKVAVGAVLALATVAMGIGIVVASLGMWLPNIAR